MQVIIDPKEIRIPEPHSIKDPILRSYLNELVRSLDTLKRGSETDLFKTVVIIQSRFDFPELINSTSTLESDKLYLIDGEIDMEDISLIIPTGGASIAGLNGARDTSALKSSKASYTLFKTASGSFSGDLLMESLTLEITGAGSKVFDLDNNENQNAIDITGINFLLCTSLGELTAYRQLLLTSIGFILILDGITFNGNWSGGMAVDTAIAINFPVATLFKKGTALVISGSIRSNINFLSVETSSVLFDFEASNVASDGGLSLLDVRTNALDIMPNLPSSDVKARYRDCAGIRNTYVGGEYFIASATATTITSANTIVQMAGVTTYDDLQWFTGSANNEFIYDSTLDIEIEVTGNLSFSGIANNTIGLQIRRFDVSASAYVDIGSRFRGTINTAGSLENLTFFGRTAITENDRIEIWIENQGATQDITAVSGGFVGISERPS